MSEGQKMVEKGVIAYPHVSQYGTVMVPEDIADDEEKTYEYIVEHFKEVKFNPKPDFDYAGTTFDVD